MPDKSLEPTVEQESTSDPSAKIAGLNIDKVGDEQTGTNMLLYGIPGAGKTLLSATSYDVEAMRPVLYIDIEGGYETIRERYPDMDRVRVKTITDKGGRTIKSAWTQLKDLHEALRKGDGEYRTAIIDNLTEAYQLSMQDVMAATVAEHPERDIDVPAQREWGKASSQVRRWVRNMRDLDMNVIFTAHETAHTNDNGSITHVTPSLPGKLANEISAFVDYVLYLYTKDEKGEDKAIKIVRKLQTQPVGKYIAKDRSGKLPLILSDPTMLKIMEAINADPS